MPNWVVSVIDDDSSVREGTLDLLNSAGFAAESFSSADQFLKSDSLNGTSCVVADIRMPRTSGLELHDLLLQAGKNIPTILITAFPKEEDRARAIETGVCDYLTKPFSEEELLSSIECAIKNGGRTASFLSTTNPGVTELIEAAQIQPSPKLRVEELSGPDALEKITPEWEELDAQITPRTPFTSPLWATLWWQHLRQKRPAIRQEFFAHIVRDETNKLVAVVPFLITHRPGAGPLRLRLVQLFGGADGSITEHRSIICREDDELRVFQTLVRHLLDRKDKWDLFVCTGIRSEAVMRDYPGNLLKVYKKMPYYLVPMPGSWEQLRSGLSSNMKEAIRKCYKHLAREGHTFTFRVVTQPENIAASLDRLLALHSERAQFKYAPRHRDLFAKVSQRAFIGDVAYLMAQRGQLRIFELEVDGNIVACRMAFLLGNELYLYYSGYDLAWRKQSIMTTLMCECFKWAIENGVKIVNLSKGKDSSKIRWRGYEVVFHDALLMSPTRRGSLFSRGYDLLSRRPGLFVKLTEFLGIVAGVATLIKPTAVGFC